MPGYVYVKDGVTFPAVNGPYQGKIAPAGFVILSAVQQVAAKLGLNLWITSGSDGCHSGETDPHHSGEAYDIRTNNLTEDQKNLVLSSLIAILGTTQFYAFLEAPGTPNEHIHAQRRKGTVYPPNDAEQVQDAAADAN